MAAKLPLATRKNLRDAEASWKPSFEKIKKVIGVEWKWEQNWEAIFNALPESIDWRNRLGEAVGLYLEGIASQIESQIKSPKAKAALKATVHKNTIMLVIGEIEDGYYYQQTKFVDGVLVHVVPADRMPCNTGDSGKEIPRLLKVGNLPLLAVENIDENTPKLNASMAAISKALGGNWTFQVDYDALFNTLADTGDFERGYRWRLGEVMTWYLDGLQSKIVSLAKDDMVKEAINEAGSKKIVRFVLGELTTGGGTCCESRFADGVLELVSPEARFCSNCGDVAAYLEKVL